MPRRVVPLMLALAAGGATAAVVPAMGQTADHPVVASDVPSHNFSPATITIAVGDSVTWSYPTGTSAHNVHFTDAGSTFPDQPASPSPPGWSVQRTFDTAGTYHYQCALHATMRGTIVVGDGGTTATTTTTTPATTTTETTTTPVTTTTATTTTPTSTTTTTGPAAAPSPTTTAATPDTRAPAAGHVRILRGRLRMTLSERAHLKGTLARGARHVVRLSRTLPRGAASLKLPAHLRAGRYRLRFTLTDAAGNTTAARTVRFVVQRR